MRMVEVSLTGRSPRVPCSRPLVSFQCGRSPHSVPLSTDLCGPRQLLQRGRLLALGGLRLPLPLPHPGHATVPAVQCGPVYSQSSSQVRGGFSKGTGQAARVASPSTGSSD